MKNVTLPSWIVPTKQNMTINNFRKEKILMSIIWGDRPWQRRGL